VTPHQDLALPPDTGRPTRVLVATNGSAGSGKTSFVTAVAYAAASRGKKVLVIPMDKQRDTSHLFGCDDPDADENLPTLFDVIDGVCTLDEAVVPAKAGEGGDIISNLWFVPESRQLGKIEFKLGGETGRELWLYRQMKHVRGRFDIIFIDCPGNQLLATQGGIIASTEIVGCIKSQEKEARGLTELEDEIADWHETFGHTGFPKEVTWIVIGEGAKEVKQGRGGGSGKVFTDLEAQIRETFGDLVLRPTVRRDVKIPEAYTAQKPVTLYAPKSEAAQAYVKMGRQMKLYR
jgi:cellulose biosynthesis protein BcsQ